MFFIISKLLAFLITPLIWVFILFIWGLLSKNKIHARRFLISGCLVLYIFSNSFLLDEIVRLWEFPATAHELTETYDVGIVLGGMLSYDKENDQIQFQRPVDRLLQAVVLYKKGKIRTIMYTGGSGHLLNHLPEAIFAKRFLLEIGIPDQDINIESRSNNTYENAIFTKPILNKKMPQGKFLLITSAMHMKRAKACFEKIGIPIKPYSVDRYSGPRKFIFDHCFIPDAGTLFLWNDFLHEWVGYISYRCMGYI